jgi:glycosyltransferase involved in cell wall biosynthesis
MKQSEHVVSEVNIGLSEKIPEVTWLICTNVCNEQLHQAINSCLDQTFLDFELVLVANGPFATEISEKVRCWFGSDPRIRVVITEVRYLNFSLTLGLHHARAKLIARMDSDDISTKDRLELQVNYMRTHPDVAVLGSAYEIINNQGLPKKKICLPTEDKDIRRRLVLGNPICHPSVMFRRHVIVEAGGYLGYIYAEDYDLWVRLAVNPTIRFANLHEVCLLYRQSDHSKICRRNKAAYASVLSSQIRCFILNPNHITWFLASILSFIKAMVSRQK